MNDQDAGSPANDVFDTAKDAQAFPVLTPAQMERVQAHGRLRDLAEGEILFEAGDEVMNFYVVVSGEIEIVRPEGTRETVVVRYHAGQFSGEINLLSGRRAISRGRSSKPTRAIELERSAVVSLVQSDSELGEIILRAFILRRVALIAHGIGDAVLVGSQHSSGTLRIKEFLTRNGYPYSYLDLDRDEDTQMMLDRFQIQPDDIPVLICRGTIVLKNPSNQRIAACLDLNLTIDPARVRDVIVVGAGPSGLAAAVYAASEGLDVIVLESVSPGGQAASSSRIENYLGFPTGISGQELAARAFVQAQKFGAEILIARSATHLECGNKPYVVAMDDGSKAYARTIIIATGAAYRKLAVENLESFEGVGIYYSATVVEEQLCAGEEAVVVGGGNSAGQAAISLAQTASRVYILVRAKGLAESMSRYLIRRIEENPNIVLMTQTEIVALQGDGRLDRVRWTDRSSGKTEDHDIHHVFVMTGANPNTRWLSRCVALDSSGFIVTGPDISKDTLVELKWPLGRPPFLLETSRPGVFAVGDVRSGNMKRVASAVGEGSSVISFVHQVLSQ